jgi:hypothetical protein
MDMRSARSVVALTSCMQHTGHACFRLAAASWKLISALSAQSWVYLDSSWTAASLASCSSNLWWVCDWIAIMLFPWQLAITFFHAVSPFPMLLYNLLEYHLVWRKIVFKHCFTYPEISHIQTGSVPSSLDMRGSTVLIVLLQIHAGSAGIGPTREVMHAVESSCILALSTGLPLLWEGTTSKIGHRCWNNGSSGSWSYGGCLSILSTYLQIISNQVWWRCWCFWSVAWIDKLRCQCSCFSSE